MNAAYTQLLAELKSAILTSRTQAIRQVNRSMIELYWQLGKRIVESQEEHGWGKSIVEDLSRDLRQSFPDSTGFSVRNLWDMRRFYLTYKDFPNLQTVSADLSWSHNRLLLPDTLDYGARAFYLQKSREHGWSYRVLIHQIKAQAYERQHLESKTHNFQYTLEQALADQADETIKSSYNLEFLNIKEQVHERELEDRLEKRLRDFILELGYGFTFVGRQQKITLGENDYYLDLLFYHRKLRCLVAIELKIGKFLPEYAGKMNFYLEVMDDHLRLPEENPSIGIILCTEKDDLVVEYALRSNARPIGVSKYKLHEELPKELDGQLPTPEQLRATLTQR